MKWAHEITNGRGLLQAEPDCHGQVHRHGFAVERCGLVFPLFQSVLSSLMKQRGPETTFMDVTRPVASINASTRTLPETCWLLASSGYVGGTEKISLAV